MDKIVVRKAHRSEVPVLAKIQCAAWRAAFGDIITERTMERLTDAAGNAEILMRVFDSRAGSMYIAGMGKSACGMLFWQPETSGTGAEIIALHTVKRVWGSGAAAMLMKAALEDIYDCGKSEVKLWVFRENKRARRFCEKCGFRPTGRERASVYDRAVEMQYRRIL